MTTASKLLEQIEAFLIETGMSATAFGVKVQGDREFVFRLRAGKDVRGSSIDNCHAYMSKHLATRATLKKSQQEAA